MGRIPVEVECKPSGGHWLALCPSLGLITQGESRERAEENIQEMLMLFFDSCLKRGVLERVLRQAGFTKEKIALVVETAQANNMRPLVAAEAECRV